MSQGNEPQSSTAGKSDDGEVAQVKTGVKRSRCLKAEKQAESEAYLGKWSLLEKAKLLEGIRRYGADNPSVVARIVKTRTAEEVETYIEILRKNDPRENKRRRDECGDVFETEAEPDFKDLNSFMSDTEAGNAKRSPIEAWTELISEMTFFEPHDYSTEVSEVFGLIARNEDFTPSEVPRLKWKKIYQFISDLLQDKAEIQELSDVESHIVLDMMQKLGDTLHTSETGPQKKMLIRKYKLLNTPIENTEEGRRHRQARVNRALNNDLDIKKDDPLEDGLLLNRNTTEVEEQTGEMYTDTSIKASSSSHSLSNDNIKTSTSSTSLQTDRLKATPSSVELRERGEASSSVAEAPDCPPTTADPPHTAATDTSWKSKQKSKPKIPEFKKPPLFTLNPLCIPTSMLRLKPKVDFH